MPSLDRVTVNSVTVVWRGNLAREGGTNVMEIDHFVLEARSMDVVNEREGGREGDRAPPKSCDWVNHGRSASAGAAIKGSLHSKSLMHARTTMTMMMMMAMIR